MNLVRLAGPALLLSLITLPAVAEDDPTISVRFTGSGAQVVPPVETDAVATCSAVLDPLEESLTIECEHDVENLVAAHVHVAPAGENGPILFTFSDPTSPFSQSFPVDEATVDLLLERELYIDLHSEAHPDGEVRGQIDGCFESPLTLCVHEDRFQIFSFYAEGEDLAFGRAVRFSDLGGFFTFFSDDNPEIDAKVLDGCDINGHYWVFAAGLTDVASALNVFDFETDTLLTYSNDAGDPFELVRDVEAFACE